MFREARSTEDLAAREHAVWCQRGSFAVWCVARDRVGWALWGHLGTDDAAEMKRIWLHIAPRLARPYDFVLDARLVKTLSQGAFELIREFSFASKRGLRRFALLVGDEQPAAAQLGLYAMAPPQHEWRSFRAVEEAGAWLGWPDAATLFEAVDARVAASAQEAPIVAAVRRHLTAAVESGRTPSVRQTAAAIAVSPRALQRALSDAASSFSDELDRARVERASRLLTEPSAKLESIARAVGFADGKSLVRLFRRVRGETPRAFRDRLRD
jgi:AraC-like DNA-binding protein